MQWPLAYISRRGLAGLSEVLAPIYGDERKGLKFKLEFELRWADSVFVLFAIAIPPSWPPGLPVIFLLWFGQRALNTGGPVSISGLASRAPGGGGALASFCTRSGYRRWWQGPLSSLGLQAGSRDVSVQALQAAAVWGLRGPAQPQLLCGTLSTPAAHHPFFVSLPSPGSVEIDCLNPG